MPIYWVEGSAYYAAGFAMRIHALDEASARAGVHRLVTEGARGRGPKMDGHPELQEVNIEVFRLWQEGEE